MIVWVVDAALLVESVVRAGVVVETSGGTIVVLVAGSAVVGTVDEAEEATEGEVIAVLVSVCAGDFGAISDSGTVSWGKRPSCSDRFAYSSDDILYSC